MGTLPAFVSAASRLRPSLMRFATGTPRLAMPNRALSTTAPKRDLMLTVEVCLEIFKLQVSQEFTIGPDTTLEEFQKKVADRAFELREVAPHGEACMLELAMTDIPTGNPSPDLVMRAQDWTRLMEQSRKAGNSKLPNLSVTRVAHGG